MNLDVSIHGQVISVYCNVLTTKQTYSFLLAKSLSIVEITDNGNPVPYDIGKPQQLLYRPEMVKYTVTNIHDGTLNIHYHGTLSGFFGYLQQHLIHFSYYNGWFPIGYDAECPGYVKMHMDNQWEMIHGTYEKADQCWYYTVSKADKERHDCNILLLNKSYYHSKENNAVRLYYLPEFEEKMQLYYMAYSSIYRFYISLYGVDKIGKMDIVFLCVKEQLGAYYRDGLIVFSTVPDNPADVIHGFAHEAGHAYGCGASVETWEDWLNETTAEWSALLYEIENDPDSFSNNIQRYKMQMQGKPLQLRGAENSRPDNVHEVGTLVYYEIYMQYGKGAIKTLLKTFDALEQKNTASFLASLKSGGFPEFAEMIKRHLSE